MSTADLLDQIPESLFVVDDERTIVEANAACCELFHVHRENLLGRRLDELLGEFPVDLDSCWRLLLADGRIDGTCSLLRGDRGRTIIEYRARAARTGGRHVWTLRDISRAAPRRSNFALLSDELPFVITRFDRQRRHLFVNRAVTDATGVPPEEFLGKTNEELGMPADLVTVWNAALDSALAGSPHDLVFEWPSPDGTRTFDARILPETLEDGRVETVLGITRDITAEVADRRRLVEATEERVRQLELERRRLAALFAESLAAVSVVRGPDFTIELLNPRAQELWGRSDTIIGQPLLVGLPELEGQGFEDLLRGVVATGQVYRGVEVPVRIDRDRTGLLATHYFDFVYAPLRDPQGNVEGVIVHAHDVTDKILARERMQLAIQTTGVGIWEWNVVTGEVRWDRQMRELYGLSPDHPVTYATWRDAVLPEDLALQEQILEDMVRRAGQSSREFRIARYDDGRVRDIACVESVRVDSAGKPEWVVGTNLDVTERRHAERALRESEARFRAMADHVPQLAWMAERDGYLDWFNRQWLEFTGSQLEDNVGDGWKQFHHPDHVEAVREKFARHLREGIDWEDTFPLRRRDGVYRWFLSRMKAIRDPAGNIVRFFGTNTDITEHRELEESLRKLSAELSVADRRKDEFLATLAHELRNPLAPIRNGLSVLRAATSAEVSERTFEMMERQVSHLVRLVDDLLDISRVRSGKITLAKEPLRVSEIVELAIEACAPSVEAADHQLVRDITDEPLVVHGDRTRLVQVISNLVTNAAKYSERGGRVSIRVARDDAYAVIRVSDTGVGIDPAHISTLWDMFTQVRDTLEKAQGGLGIGLALARNLVVLHGGEIKAESAGLGHGSTFEVRLPLAEVSALSPPSTTDATREAAVNKRRILIVDDNIDAAETLGMLLELAGHEIATVHTGPAALDAIRDFAPDVVFLDIGLPGMDGYEVARHVRADPTRAGIVLIALTGWGSAADQQRTRDAGFDVHLTKPIRLATIEDVLSKLS